MKKWFTLITSVILALSLAACGSSSETGSTASTAPSTSSESTKPAEEKEPVEIVFQSHITPNLTAELYDDILKQFETENPDIKVKRINAPDTDVNKYLKTLLASGDFPDVIHNASFQDFVKADALLEIPIDDDVKKIRNYETNLIDGKLYNMFGYVQPQSLIFYNKDLFNKAGITNLPTTWDEFTAVSEKLKQNKITPIMVASDWAGFGLSTLSAPEIFGHNTKWYADRYEKKVVFKDANWVEAANRYSDYAKKGYFYEGALSIKYAQGEQEFLKGTAAMYPMGVWFTAAADKAKAPFEVGVFASPTKDGLSVITGGVNQGGFAVSKKSKHPEAALRLVKFLALDPDTHKMYGKADGLLSNLVEPIPYDMTPLQKEAFDLVSKAEVLVGQSGLAVGRAPVPGIAAEYTKAAQNMITGKSGEEEMKKLDEFWDKYSQ